MSRPVTLVWFRRDLRLEDNPALSAAVGRGGAVVPVFLWAPEHKGRWVPGAASRVWLHHSLDRLDASLRTRGSALTLRYGDEVEQLAALVHDTGADAVYWNRRYEPVAAARETAVRRALEDLGVAVQTFSASLLVEPAAIATRQGNPYQVFTPFWKACLERIEAPDPVSIPSRLPASSRQPRSLKLHDLRLLPRIDWAAGIRDAWTPGEAGGQARLRRFIDEALPDYADAREVPSVEGTSRLSPHLHFGEIGPWQVWRAVQEAAALDARPGTQRSLERFLAELGWREFSYHLLSHFPHVSDAPLRASFDAFPWRDDEAAFKAWTRGRTGYPIVDAGMRELWTTGWMHNRVRMIVASFLTKDLLIPWQRGAGWFWDTLVDADLANNTQGWQWTAGCGADAAPYFRIFNPVSQGEKFDPDGVYVGRWVPEIAGLPLRWRHHPWEAPPAVLEEAGVELGRNYPHPIVDHGEARSLALAAYESIRHV